MHTHTHIVYPNHTTPVRIVDRFLLEYALSPEQFCHLVSPHSQEEPGTRVQCINTHNLQLVGACAIGIAAKFCEGFACLPRLRELTGKKYDMKQVRNAWLVTSCLMKFK